MPCGCRVWGGVTAVLDRRVSNERTAGSRAPEADPGGSVTVAPRPPTLSCFLQCPERGVLCHLSLSSLDGLLLPEG